MLQIDGMSGVCMIQVREILLSEPAKSGKGPGQIVLASTGSQPIRRSNMLNSQKPWGETGVKQAQPTPQTTEPRKPIRRDTVMFVKLEGVVGSFLSESRLQGQSWSENFQAANQQELVHLRMIQREVRPCGFCSFVTLSSPTQAHAMHWGKKCLGSPHAFVQLGECFQLWCCSFRSFQKFRDCRRQPLQHVTSMSAMDLV